METIGNNIFFENVESIIAQQQCVTIRVKGFSMRPLLRNGLDEVVVHPMMPQYLKCGDIVLFRYRGHHVMHRIIARDKEQLTLSGDGNYRRTEHCTTTDVVGIIRQVIRPNGDVIECSSRKWRLQSTCWLALPQIVRRYLLAVAARL